MERVVSLGGRSPFPIYLFAVSFCDITKPSTSSLPEPFRALNNLKYVGSAEEVTSVVVAWEASS